MILVGKYRKGFFLIDVMLAVSLFGIILTLGTCWIGSMHSIERQTRNYLQACNIALEFCESADFKTGSYTKSSFVIHYTKKRFNVPENWKKRAFGTRRIEAMNFVTVEVLASDQSDSKTSHFFVTTHILKGNEG
jgi:hypothetical protein